ncbi:MAG: VTT domain-containing protein [Kurthia gibsonii]|uniref:VTT domain-containing protein n=1 Tax=Kurthia gibsonii TaxID=33946 RepID=A0ABU9LKS0_9BACL|nr:MULTISPECIES: VTT domain-containing protein [Kurthia]MEB7772481.1 VTT domain-containing protein [Kurthia gibsonii]HZG13296.1 VTT domain-containing protein [Kurthia gibsonii]
MSMIEYIISFIVHIDQHLVEIIRDFGNWTYGILFAIVFVETGLVIFPFLPGDSLLFAAGTFAAIGSLSLPTLLLVFFFAAVIGDSLNYEIGKKVGTTIRPGTLMGKMINQEKMNKAEAFFNKHGGKTIVIARFMPFIRTFIPFVAGASRMKYSYFLMYNIVGAALWVGSCTLLGYFFGNIPIVKENFSTVLIVIIFLSVIPAFVGFIKSRKSTTS